MTARLWSGSDAEAKQPVAFRLVPDEPLDRPLPALALRILVAGNGAPREWIVWQTSLWGFGFCSCIRIRECRKKLQGMYITWDRIHWKGTGAFPPISHLTTVLPRKLSDCVQTTIFSSCGAEGAVCVASAFGEFKILLSIKTPERFYTKTGGIRFINVLWWKYCV